MQTGIKLAFVLFIFMVSCVSPRVVEDLETKLAAIEKANQDCKENLKIKEDQLDRSEKALKDAELDLKDIKRFQQALEQDTLLMGRNYRRLKIANNDLNAALEKQVTVNRQMAAQSEAKNKELYNELLGLQKELEDRKSVV